MQRFLLSFFAFASACGGSVATEITSDGSISDTNAVTDAIAVDTPLADGPITVDIGIDRACTAAGMCMHVPASCCGACGTATRADGIAVPRDKAAEYRTRACATDGGGIGCPECAGLQDPNLHAFCRGGACAPVDVLTDAVSACATDADCQLAQGICCGPCPGELGIVAVAKSKLAEFNSQICDPRVDCTVCPMPSTTTSIARCDPATKHCVAVKMSPPG